MADEIRKGVRAILLLFLCVNTCLGKKKMHLFIAYSFLINIFSEEIENRIIPSFTI